MDTLMAKYQALVALDEDMRDLMDRYETTYQQTLANKRALQREAMWLHWSNRLAESSLSPRQCEVITYVACGASYKEISKRLGVSTSTVKNHMTVILDKLNALDRVEAVLIILDMMDGRRE